MATGPARPVFLDVFRIRFPVGAVCSIGHRLSGVLIVLLVPFAVWLLDLSLSGALGYARASALVHRVPVEAALAVFVWALAHHALAGVRHLLMDIDIGSSLAAARRSAWLVNVAAAAIALFAAGVLA